ncbi:PREDICTED: uncharacterized protein LOC109468899 [Branchiostoma belcheri]|uniref:Uncharacterized protein LOC109468899 n=1 Tax=Branchiostoma belcheri TaxID=7741 RepID=A0A6P4YZU8_BRABE|nr:PREDICTED: uncharacterized protein LOC109468899 [Branchiostoma belcheri]
MATRMWLMFLIAVGLLMNFSCTKADTADDVGKGAGKKAMRGWWDVMEEYLGYLEVAEEGYKFYSRVSSAYEKLKKGKMTGSQFLGKVGKSVIRGGCSLGGSAMGTVAGAAIMPGVGAVGGSYAGEKLGDNIGDYVTGETDSQFAKQITYLVDKAAFQYYRKEQRQRKQGEQSTMAKPMSLMCLIAIGLLLSFAYVNGETLKSTPGDGQTADDARKGSPKGEDVGNGALKETPETLMAQLGNLKDKLDALRTGVGIFAKGYELYDRTSANYKRFKKGEMSQEEFESEVRKEVGGVGAVAGTVAGATLGAWYLGPALGQLAIPIPGLGAFVGGYVGGKVGAMFGELVT